MSMKPSNISISRILMISYGIVIALFALTKNGSRQRGKQDRTVNESDLYCTYLLSKNVIKKETGHSYKNVLFLLGGDGGI